MMKRYLALDTATEACSVALWQDGRILERYEVAGRSHTERLLPMLHSLLAEAQCGPGQIDGFVCGVGPGSFAGVRIGVGVVKGLALALDRPVVPVMSLTSLAQRVIRLRGLSRIAAVIDARMHEVYCARFENDAGRARLIGAARVCTPEDAPALGDGDWHAVGTGWRTHGESLRTACRSPLLSIDGEALPHAHDALLWSLPDWAAGRVIGADALEPVYLRDKVALTVSEQRERRAPA